MVLNAKPQITTVEFRFTYDEDKVYESQAVGLTDEVGVDEDCPDESNILRHSVNGERYCAIAAVYTGQQRLKVGMQGGLAVTVNDVSIEYNAVVVRTKIQRMPDQSLVQDFRADWFSDGVPKLITSFAAIEAERCYEGWAGGCGVYFTL